MGADIVFRMARMEKVSPELLQLIERSIANETDLAVSHGTSSSGGPGVVAAVLNFVPATLEKALLESVAARDASLSDQIKNMMFVFEDIATLDVKSLQRLLRDIDVKTLASPPRIVTDTTKPGTYAIGEPRRVEVYTTFADFTAKLTEKLAAGEKALGISATGSFDAATSDLSTQRVLVEMKPAN